MCDAQSWPHAQTLLAGPAHIREAKAHYEAWVRAMLPEAKAWVARQITAGANIPDPTDAAWVMARGMAIRPTQRGLWPEWLARTVEDLARVSGQRTPMRRAA